MAFTIERLTDALQIDAAQAAQIIDLVRGRTSPFDVPAVDVWRQSCYHEPDPQAPETIMLAIDAVLGTCGTQAIWGENSETHPAAEYANAGDTYATTIVYDYIAGKYRLMSCGDFVERYERRYRLR